ncbi:MAG: hypothetical protein J6R47_02875 [Acholeplasmatales bacterium]|nr:hypothetical protein [Acholeplasmatales bacterium]
MSIREIIELLGKDGCNTKKQAREALMPYIDIEEENKSLMKMYLDKSEQVVRLSAENEILRKEVTIYARNE